MLFNPYSSFVVLEKEKISFFDLRKKIQLVYTFPPELVNNLDVINSEGLRDHLLNFLKENNISEGTSILAITDNLVFQKHFESNELLNENINNFLAGIPFEPEKIGQLIIRSKTSTDLFATNLFLINFISKILTENHIEIKFVVPQSIYDISEINLKSIPLIIKDKNKIYQYNFFKNEDRTTNIKPQLFIIPLLIIVVLSTGLFLLKTGSNKKTNIIQQNTPTESLSPSPVPTITITKETVKINVLNGTGKSGVAGNFANALKAKGYPNIETGNADKYDYTNVLIIFKAEATNLWNNLIEDLGSKYKVSSSSSTLETTAKEDIQIIIGK